jgi:AcrR family transcriptional regulator
VRASASPVASSSAAGRPRSDLHATVFAATLRSVRELGYAGATMDRIAVAAGVAKTTLYRRWPSKGALIVDCLIDAFGRIPFDGADRDEVLSSGIHWLAGKIGEPGVGAALAGVFSDAVNDPDLREILSTRLQEPYRLALQEALGEPPHRIRLLMDVVTGTLIHRMGMTGEPMADADVAALTEMVLRTFRS